MVTNGDRNTNIILFRNLNNYVPSDPPTQNAPPSRQSPHCCNSRISNHTDPGAGTCSGSYAELHQKYKIRLSCYFTWHVECWTCAATGVAGRGHGSWGALPECYLIPYLSGLLV